MQQDRKYVGWHGRNRVEERRCKRERVQDIEGGGGRKKMRAEDIGKIWGDRGWLKGRRKRT